MPELPEVETIARQLNVSLLGKMIEEIKVYRYKNFVGDKQVLVGGKIKKIGRKAKMVEIELEGKEIVVQIHLKMTGQLIYIERTQELEKSKIQSEEKRIVGGHPGADWVNSLPSKHTRIEIVFDDNSVLFFNDMRAFGWMRIVQKTQKIETEKNQVPDIVDEEFSLDYFEKVLIKNKRPIKIVLLDQQLMGGIGNIYANDALNMAKISPTRKACELTKEEVKKLYEAVLFVINLGIECGGASAANYVDTRGLGGTYQNFFLTYKREGLPCKNCGGKIVKIKLGGRGTFYCPSCQK